jgi:hypothetical protein
VTIGQAGGEGPIDIPVIGELARIHATLLRDGEGYVLDASRDAFINGATARRTVLNDQDRITLGSTCQLLFSQPIKASSTAHLRTVSNHRFHGAIDGVILMSQSLLLGPTEGNHIWVPGLFERVVLTRGPDGLAVQFPGKYCVDGERVTGRMPLSLTSAVHADEFSFSLEPVPPRFGLS